VDTKPIIVTGTGRSGTSAVARVLHESGVSMGQHFAGPSPQNATGYYEELSVAALNDKIYADCGLAPSNAPLARALRRARRFLDPTYKPPLGPTYVSREEVLRAAAKYRRAMEDLVSQLHSPGGWKGTHLCWTLEAWLSCFPQQPRIVLCLRSPEEVAGSAMDYFGLTDDAAREWTAQLWLNQNQRLVDVIEDYGLECLTLEYAELIANTAATVERLSAFVDRPLDPSFVEPSLRHHAASVPERFAPMYERVRALSTTSRTAVG
jgi:hypothetical protein